MFRPGGADSDESDDRSDEEGTLDVHESPRENLLTFSDDGDDDDDSGDPDDRNDGEEKLDVRENRREDLLVSSDDGDDDDNAGDLDDRNDGEEKLNVRENRREDLLVSSDDGDDDDNAGASVRSGNVNNKPVALRDSRLGRDFEVLQSQGHGSFGQILMCKHIIDQKGYAIKRIPILTNGDTGTPMEIYALSRLQHPGIVRYYQVWKENYVKSDLTSSSSDEDTCSKDHKYGKECHYIQMESCSRALEHVWKEKVDRRKAWILFVQIAEAIGYLHQQGILHCDLSPKNILLDWAGENIKIIDFGLARFKDGFGPDGVSITMLKPESLGNKDYRAPEIMTPCSRITEKVDIYSMGMIAVDLFHTSMHERSCKRRDLIDNRKLPACFNTEPAYIRKLLLQLVDVNPDSRPTAEAVFHILSNHIRVESMWGESDANMEVPVIVVTRATKSTGLLVVLALLKAGCKVLVNFAKSVEDDKDVLEKIGVYGAQVINFKGDADVDADTMFRTAELQWRSVDVLVNDAGSPRTTLSNSPCVGNCTQEAAKIMLRNKKGRIINIASGREDYVIDLTRAAANKYGSSNIRVNAIVPRVAVCESLERWSRGGEVADLVKALTLKDVTGCATEQAHATSSALRRRTSATSLLRGGQQLDQAAARLVVLLALSKPGFYLNGQVLTYSA